MMGGVLDVVDDEGVVGPVISNTEIGGDVPLGIGLGVLDAIPDASDVFGFSFFFEVGVPMTLSGVISGAMEDAVFGALVEAMTEEGKPVQVTG